MTKIILSADCGNSPKNIFVKDLTVAFAKGDMKFILSSVTDDISWNIIGGKLIQGKDDCSKYAKEMNKDKVTEIKIFHIATHGVSSGAVNGEIKLKNGKTYSFCDIYKFSNAKGEKIKEITSYIIELK